MSSFWKAAKWPLAVILLIWFALGVNAWSYFSKSGLPGVYYSAIHAVDVVTLPDPPKVPSVPDGLRKLREDEVRFLIVQVTGDRLGFGLKYNEGGGGVSYRFTSPNTYRAGSNLGPALQNWSGRFVRDGDRICTLARASSSTDCYRLFRREDGKLFRYRQFPEASSNNWQEVEIIE